MIRIKALTMVAAIAAFIAVPTLALAQDAKHSFKMATGWPGGPLMDIGAKAFAERVDQMSDGRIKIQVFPGGTLGNALKVTETVKNGVAEMGHTWMGYDWGRDTTTVLFGGYAGSFDSERMLHWLYQAGGVDLQRQYRDEVFGVVSMPLFIRTAEVFLHSRKPVRTLEDMKGLKLRTAGSWLDMAKDLGAAPVTTAGGDVFPMLERGAIDATEWGTLWEDIAPGFHKVAKYLIIPGVHQPVAPFDLVINKDAWAKLSDKDKKLIETAARLTTFDSWLRIGEEDAKALDVYRKAGNEVIELAPEVQYRTREIADAWADKQAETNPWFAKVLASQRDFERRWANATQYRNVKVRATATQ
ncbi:MULTISPECIES: TRAP transporter substrate-binding protein DctP [Azospirillum]|uniref:TRAP transporter substrate-binding protein DctP n=2 Tax=Azospirillum brasilense TaxID=192 RepID=A0ABU4P0V5_AZOBR|nr:MULTISPECIES: TRAP transporter substrate-binding protein DctP [Azospirillum]MDW7557770.1 TRAP transporter substrate-binding protein DctP [Azospirillum brasilense]MDW7597393.1 TRAP transporter substrate-binding protein DctP [Azospirillum brasilense]MDW7632611.1 TRAP transporter substrate-binding protein DctP [Azospirillum brasilense]MDX5950823.1 TRAP transporter substrate-binding protein DctP [Azospirillum brasilense]OPH18661.1 C4-dicarboxylate ABC transporter substrate-binding protein [Azos